MDPKTKDLVEAAEARSAKATKGPWFKIGVQDVAYYARDPDGEMRPSGLCDVNTVWRSDKDRDFIAHARTDVPALCAAVREQDERAQRAEQERDASNVRIAELEAESKQGEDSWLEYEKECADVANPGEFNGRRFMPGDCALPSWIRSMRKYYENQVNTLEERCKLIEEQLRAYKRIANIKKPATRSR